MWPKFKFSFLKVPRRGGSTGSGNTPKKKIFFSASLRQKLGHLGPGRHPPYLDLFRKETHATLGYSICLIFGRELIFHMGPPLESFSLDQLLRSYLLEPDFPLKLTNLNSCGNTCVKGLPEINRE